MTSPRPVSATVIFAPTLESKNAHTNGTAWRSAFGVGGPFGWRAVLEDDIVAWVSRVFGDRLRYSSAAPQTGDPGRDERSRTRRRAASVPAHRSQTRSVAAILVLAARLHPR